VSAPPPSATAPATDPLRLPVSNLPHTTAVRSRLWPLPSVSFKTADSRKLPRSSSAATTAAQGRCRCCPRPPQAAGRHCCCPRPPSTQHKANPPLPRRPPDLVGSFSDPWPLTVAAADMARRTRTVVPAAESHGGGRGPHHRLHGALTGLG
jgi:hypothetical protein